MSFDLIVRGGKPVGREGTFDIGIRGETIAAVEPALEAEAGEVVEAAGCLVSPPFVDAHMHLDSTLTYGSPRVNESGTLFEGITLWGEVKPSLTRESIVERVLTYCDWAVSQGLLAIRSHVDVCDDRLLAVEALLEVREKVKAYLDIQLVAFPQDGYFRSPTAEANLERALDLGVEVVGGIPHFELTREEGRRSVRALCELAAERDLRVDLHCDETDDPGSNMVETLAFETRRLGLDGRVAGSHLTSLHSMDNAYAAKLVGLIAEAGVAAIANPMINLTLQGRYESYPKRRGVTRIPELLEAGVVCAFGQDCVLDPWYALGSADLLDAAYVGLHACQMTARAQMETCFDMVTSLPAQILGLEGHGLEPGCRASLVVLEAGDKAEAIRLRAGRRCVISRGRVVAEAPGRAATLRLPGRPPAVDRRL